MAVEENSKLDGATILKILLRDGNDSAMYKGEYMAYELLVITDRGVLRFAGCHDTGGEIKIETAQEMIDKYFGFDPADWRIAVPLEDEAVPPVYTYPETPPSASPLFIAPIDLVAGDEIIYNPNERKVESVTRTGVVVYRAEDEK